MADITTQADVKLLIDTFYGKVKQDEIIGFIFNDIIGEHWDRHLPIMYKFWDMVLLSKPGYEGYPTRTHLEVNKKIPLQKEHFDRWLLLWNDTINSFFSGEIASQAREKAKLMADLIHIKVEDSRKGNLIQ